MQHAVSKSVTLVKAFGEREAFMGQGPSEINELCHLS